MSRRTGALPISASPASLALVLSILIALAALPARADSEPATAPNAAPETAIPPAPAGEETPAQRRAVKHAERSARRAERSGAEATTPAVEPAPAATGKQGAAQNGGSAATRAARRAERAAERAARHEARAGGGASAKSVTRNAAATKPSAEKGKGPNQREREERKHQREEERRLRTGHETRKEKLARLAREEREAAEAGEAGSGRQSSGSSGTLAAAAAGLAPASTPESRSLAARAPKIAAEHGTRATAAKGRHAVRRRGTAGTGAREASLLALPAAAHEEPAAAAGRPSHAGAGSGRHRASGLAARRGASPLTTVTRIIGVIPSTVWLLVGALALAACAFATTSRLAARRARRLDRQRRALLEDVGLLQAALLPELPDRLGAVATAAAYRPASGPGAGGDFYDVFALPEGLVAVLVGDVSGHGRDALPHTTLLRYTLRAYLEAGLSPREALRAAAPALERQLGGSFATVVLATYDPRERLLTYSCAGHPHPLLTGLDPDAPIIAASAPPIGAGRTTGTRETVVQIPGATIAAFYTDGVIEARTGGELYGQRRLADVLAEQSTTARPVDAGALLDRVTDQTERRPDDMAACLIGISGGDEPPRIVAEEIELDGRDAGRKRAARFLAAAGVPADDAERALATARAIAADHGSAMLHLDLAGAAPRITLTHDNVAPLRARAMARTQEVAL